MYGLEKKGKGPFAFDLEEDVRRDPAKGRQLLQTVNERMLELKTLLRQGAENEDFDDYGVLLHGYAALQKVLNRIVAGK